MAEITIVMGKAKGHCCWPNYIACKQHFLQSIVATDLFIKKFKPSSW
jgi:hypothetical protein